MTLQFLLLNVLSFALAEAQVPMAPAPDPLAGLRPRLNPATAIVLVLLVSAFCLLGFFSVYIKNCAEQRMRREEFDLSVNYGFWQRRATRGLDVAVIESFPTFVYSAVKSLKIRKASLECAICLNEFEYHETLRFIPKCSHLFHSECIETWFSSHSTCPVCRTNLAPKPGEITAARQIFLQDSVSGTAESGSYNIAVDETMPEGTVLGSNMVASQKMPRRSRSTGWRLTGLFQRSHSTGHSLVQPGENTERFTLRLPMEVEIQLNSSLNRTKSCVAFPRARSTRRSYRSGSVGRNYIGHERFGPESCSDRFECVSGSQFSSRTGLVPLSNGSGCDQTAENPVDGLCRSFKPPFDLSSREGNNSIGERSMDRLRPDGQV